MLDKWFVAVVDYYEDEEKEEEEEEKGEEERRRRQAQTIIATTIKRIMEKMVSLCFEHSQPQRVISGLKETLIKETPS